MGFDKKKQSSFKVLMQRVFYEFTVRCQIRHFHRVDDDYNYL